MSTNPQTYNDKIRETLARMNMPMPKGPPPAPPSKPKPNPPPPNTGELYAPFYPRLKRFVEANIPIIIGGPSASSKTFSVRQLARESGRNLYTVQCTRSTGIEDIRGSRDLVESKNGIPITRFTDGLLSASLRDPNGWFLADELTTLSPGLQVVFNNLNDDSAEFVIPETGEVLRRGPNWRFFATYNPLYTGNEELQEAVKSRAVLIEADIMPRPLEYAILRQRFPKVPAEDVARTIEMAWCVRKSRENGDHQFDACLRSLLQIMVELSDGTPIMAAVSAIFLPKIGPSAVFSAVRDALTTTFQTLLSAPINLRDYGQTDPPITAKPAPSKSTRTKPTFNATGEGPRIINPDPTDEPQIEEFSGVPYQLEPGEEDDDESLNDATLNLSGKDESEAFHHA